MTVTRVVVAALSALVVLPATASAADPPTPRTGLELRVTRQRSVVRPRVAPETAVRDAEQVSEEIAAEARQERLLRELTRPLRRRPDLDYDVRSAIQGRNLRDALRR